MSKKILIIGLGHLGLIMTKSIQKSYDVYAYHYDNDKLREITDKNNIKPLYDFSGIEDMDYIMLSVRPNQIQDVLNKIDKFNLSDKLIFSVASGVTLSDLENGLSNNKTFIVRAMPNVNAQIAQSVTGLSFNSHDEEKMRQSVELFNLMGTSMVIDESVYAEFTVLAGCMPAFVWEMVNNFINTGVKKGISFEQSREIILKTFYGSIKNAIDNNLDISKAIKGVCVPGGITIKGIESLREDNLDKIQEKAFNSSFHK